MKIHVNRDGNEVGVFSPVELLRGREQGQVKPTDLAWVEGKTNWMPVSELPEEYLTLAEKPPPIPDVRQQSPVVYHPVPVARFVLCSIASMGVYHLYWFYRMWDSIRRRDRSNIWPFWRMVFAPIWTFFLVRDVERTVGVRNSQALVVTVLYVVLSVAGQLPPPYLIVSLFTFWPFLGTVSQIAALNESRLKELDEPVLARRHIALCALGLPILVLATAINFKLTPQPRILLGEEVSEGQLAYLHEADIVEEGERVLFLHRAGMFSIAEMGQLLTERRVVNYRLDTNRKSVVESVSLADVKDIRVERPEDPALQTKLEVITGERVYAFGLSRNEDRDIAFENELKRLVVEAQAGQAQ